MQAPVILIIGDDGIFNRRLTEHMPKCNIRLIETPDKKNAIRLLNQQSPNLVLVHSTSPKPGDGLDVVEQIRRADHGIPIFLVTRHSSENRVISALNIGITGYYRSPIVFDDLKVGIQKYLCPSPQKRPPKSRPVHLMSVSQMIGQSQRMRDIRAYLIQAAAGDSTVLLTGKTGTGKGLAAQLIHQNSPKSKGPFVPVNCPAIPENLIESELFGFEKGAFTGAISNKRGKFELAHNGTLFLDEISDMGLLAQAKILRIIEDKENFRLGGRVGTRLSVRVVAATNQEPEQLVSDGRLRQDLFYRLNVVRIQLPPLKDRREDIHLLADHFIQQFNNRFQKSISGISNKVTEVFLNYHWPGNVRELSNLIEACFIRARSPKIRYKDLPMEFRRHLNKSKADQSSERDRIIAALLSTNGNKSKASKRLNWSRMTLYRKISKYNLTNYLQSRHIA